MTDWRYRRDDRRHLFPPAEEEQSALDGARVIEFWLKVIGLAACALLTLLWLAW